MPTRALAFGPATVANVCAGFDLLGFALEAPGDRVAVERTASPGSIEIVDITGCVTDLPRDPLRNTASVAVASLIEATAARFGARITIDKGIPLGSGMGGSAASAVAAVVAANALLDEPLATHDLLRHAIAGEAAASGAGHADNAAPCLHGGLLVVVDHDPPRVAVLPAPSRVRSVLVRPELTIETRAARAALPRELPLGVHVEQSMRLAGLISGCHADDLELIGRSLVDLVAEPTRKLAITGFDPARGAALEAGALGFGIAGSGPSVFAWVDGDERAQLVARAVVEAFGKAGLAAASWVGSLDGAGARLLEVD